jgi:hypothetical protein
VLVMRDLQSEFGLWDGNARSPAGLWRVEGRIPGLGRTLVGVEPTVPFFSHRAWEDLPLAALKGGGLVSKYGHGYFPGAAVRGGFPVGLQGRPYGPDAAGHGHWMLWYPDDTCGQPAPCAEVRRWDNELHVYKYALPASDFPKAVYTRAVQGGGALIGYHFIAPDGTHSSVPAPALPPQDPNYPQKTVVAWGRLADGTSCGAIFDRYSDQTDLYCIAPGGAERRSATISLQREVRWHVTPEGIFYGADAGSARVLRLDPATMTVTVTELRTLLPLGSSSRPVIDGPHDAAGRPYLVVNNENINFIGLIRLDASGPVEVDLPEFQGGKLSGALSFAFDTDVILVVSTPQDTQAIQPFGRVVRLPRNGR